MAISCRPVPENSHSDTLGVSADERVGVVDRCAVHQEPCYCSSNPAVNNMLVRVVLMLFTRTADYHD